MLMLSENWRADGRNKPVAGKRNEWQSQNWLVTFQWQISEGQQTAVPRGKGRNESWVQESNYFCNGKFWTAELTLDPVIIKIIKKYCKCNYMDYISVKLVLNFQYHKHLGRNLTLLASVNMFRFLACQWLVDWQDSHTRIQAGWGITTIQSSYIQKLFSSKQHIQMIEPGKVMWRRTVCMVSQG